MELRELKDKLVDAQSVHETAHHAGQALAAIGPIEEWLAHLARHGYHYVLVAKEEWDRMTASPVPSEPKAAPTSKRLS